MYNEIVKFTNVRQNHKKCMPSLSTTEKYEKIFLEKSEIFPWQYVIFFEDYRRIFTNYRSAAIHLFSQRNRFML